MNWFSKIVSDIRGIIALGLPIIAAQISTILMGLSDTIMLGKIGKEEVAAVGVSNQIYFLISIVGMGTMASLTSLIASSKGADKKSECGELLRSGIEVGFIISLVTCGILFLISENIEILGQNTTISQMSKEYLRILNISTIPFMLFLATKHYSDGLSFSKAAMIITFVGVGLNILFNAMFLYEWFSLPGMGVKGAAMATLAARLCMALMMIYYIFNKKSLVQYRPPLISTFNTMPTIKKVIQIGLPSGLQLFFEVGAFAGAAIFVGWLGSTQLAAHQIVLGLAALSYVVSSGLSVAGSIRVSGFFGSGDYKGIKNAASATIVIVLLCMLFTCLLFITLNTELVQMFISDEAVIYTASSILIIAGMFQLSDGLQVAILGILRGMEDVRIPTWITLFAYWVISLPVGYILAFKFNLGIDGLWYGLLCGLSLSAILLVIRLYFVIKKRNKPSGV